MRGEVYRVFIAIDLDDSLKEPIIRVQRELLQAGVDMKPVEPENLHITLRFVGEISKDLVEELKKRLLNVKFPTFEVKFRGIGAFPSVENPRVLWIGVERNYEKLVELHEIIMKLTGDIGERDDREFKPHLTIGRVKGLRNKSRYLEVVKKYEGYDFGSQVVDRIKLKRSVLTPRGPIYSDLLVINLG